MLLLVSSMMEDLVASSSILSIVGPSRIIVRTNVEKSTMTMFNDRFRRKRPKPPKSNQSPSSGLYYFNQLPADIFMSPLHAVLMRAQLCQLLKTDNMTELEDDSKLTRYPTPRNGNRKKKDEGIKPPSRRVRCPTCGQPYSSEVGLTQCKRCNRPYVKDDPDWDPVRVNERINGGLPVPVTDATRATGISLPP
jgi:hypothetical protein